MKWDSSGGLLAELPAAAAAAAEICFVTVQYACVAEAVSTYSSAGQTIRLTHKRHSMVQASISEMVR